jgi:hypothetical protein
MFSYSSIASVIHLCRIRGTTDDGRNAVLTWSKTNAVKKIAALPKNKMKFAAMLTAVSK